MTAVEWLAQQLQVGKELSTVLSQAKEMEKQQIIDAYIEGYSSNLNEGDSEKYYNETYKKETK
jgi:hypothetical protein